MSSRRRGGNTGNSSPVVTRQYDLRDRTKSKGDAPEYTRPNIKNTGKDRAAEQNVKYRASRRTAKQDKPDTDDDSDDGSEYSNSSRSDLEENGRQSRFTTNSTSKNVTASSARNQPLSSRPESTYTADDKIYTYVRPSIRTSVDEKGKRPLEDTGSTVRPPSSARQPTDYTNDEFKETSYKEERRTLRSTNDKDKKDYKAEESWRDRTQTQRSQFSSEDDEADEKEVVQWQKPKDQSNETSYKEERRTLRSANRIEDPSYRQRSVQMPPPEFQAAASRSLHQFSDDDEVKISHQQTRAVYPRPIAADKTNHYPERSGEQKANIVKKPLTKSIGFAGTCMKYFVPTFLVLLVGAMAALYVSPMSLLKIIGQMTSVDKPIVKTDLKEDFGDLRSIFPSQSEQMWSRSRRILELHLKNWKGNTEPAIILLTGARDAEQTLLCLGTRLADIYSSSLNGSSIVISGLDWASGSTEEVKESIDRSLSEGFQATARAAVLHRLELLPAGSLLILYKYCDHESAVFKDVALLLTVLLDDATLEKEIPLPELEEKLRDFLLQDLIDSNARASHDRMDEDKFSGVWSRISHVVLPVFPEENIPQKCVKKEN